MPTAIAGTERARNWKRLQFPKVTVQFGEPIRFERVETPTREQSQAASEIVFEDVRTLHGAAAQGGPARRRARRPRGAPRGRGRPPAGPIGAD